MHVHFLDPYRPGGSLLHRLDARLKLLLCLGFILTAALLPPGAWAAYILLLGMVLAVEIVSEIGMAYLFKRSMLALPFVLAAFPVIFTLEGGGALFSFNLGGWTLTAYQAGLERFLSIALKSWLSLQAAILLASSTPFPDLLAAMRAVHIPRLVVATFALMWRYLFVLVDEALRLLRARSARSGQSERPGLKTGGSLAWRARVAGGMSGSLLLRGIERSERIYMAMLARGYDGELRAFPQPPLAASGWLALLFGFFIFSGLLVIAYLI